MPRFSLLLTDQNDPLHINLNTFPMGDLNRDWRIDGADLGLWQRNYRSPEKEIIEAGTVPPEKSIGITVPGLTLLVNKLICG